MLYSPQQFGLHAWLSPSGELFRVAYFEHDQWALFYLKKSPSELDKTGWLRICDNTVIRQNYTGHIRLTEYQRINLESLGFDLEEFSCAIIGPQKDDWDEIPFAPGSQGWNYHGFANE